MNRIKNLFNKNNIIMFLILLIITFLVMLMSPLNIFSPNGVSGIDSSVFKTIGYYMKDGLLPYKDMFDHKGPILYLINYLGYIISPNRGIWIIEFIFMFISTFFIYKSSRLKCSKPISVFITFTVLSLLCLYFEQGNLCEEYALPFELISLYIFLKYFLEKDIDLKYFIVSGISLAIVSMIRVNMIGLWIVFCFSIFIKSLINKKYKELFTIIGYFLIGITLVFVPLFIWLLKCHIFKDFIDCYFKFNFSYTDVTNKDKLTTFIFFFKNPIVFGSLLYLLFKQDKGMKYIALFNYFIGFYLVIMSGQQFYHYGMTLIPLLIYPYMVILSQDKYNWLKVIIILIITIIFNIVPYVKNMNYKTNIDELVSDINYYSSSDDYITVFGNYDCLYFYGKRKSASRFTYQNPIFKYNDDFAVEYINDLNENQPKLIIIVSNGDKIDYSIINDYVLDNNYSLTKSYYNEFIKLYSK